MKRTNLVLDEQLLDQAVRLLGAKTYSAAVNTALEELIRIRKLQSDQVGRYDRRSRSERLRFETECEAYVLAAAAPQTGRAA